MRPWNHILADIKRILHIARRVIFGGYSKLEIVFVELYLRSFGYIKAHREENVPYLVIDLRERAARPAFAPGLEA